MHNRVDALKSAVKIAGPFTGKPGQPSLTVE